MLKTKFIMPSRTLVLAVLSLSRLSSARHWTDINTFHELVPEDTSFSVEEVQMEFDGLFFTPEPSAAPSSAPTVTFAPTITKRPTDDPSVAPTDYPSVSPSTSQPSMSPTATFQPSDVPSAAPSDDPFPFNPAPSNPPNSYINYRPGSPYGPDEWGDYWEPPEDNYYFREFTSDGFGSWDGVFRARRLDRNSCNGGLQSPIDVVRSFNGTHFSSCRGFGHQILAGWGDFELFSDDVKKLIEPNKLRLVYRRRDCHNENLPECRDPEPAFGDFPNGWGGKADVLHIDFKVPSEHWVNGISYDGEMQIFHGHVSRARMPTAAVVIKAIPGVHNPQLQLVLDEFQAVFDKDADDCDNNRRRERRKLAQAHRILKGKGLWESIVDYASYWKYSLWSDAPKMSTNATDSRNLRAEWMPYHPLLAPSPYFYAYAGSMTEPPCTEMVNWRIIRRPMLISTDQLDQMKTLLFNHVDSRCRRTSVHFNRASARPIKPTNGRTVVRCSSLNYEHDNGIFPSGRGTDSYDLTLPLI